jgi:hypothetical protein
MTVCVASLFHWNYGTVASPVWGVAAIAASDRMITAFDVEYEPAQLKFAFVTLRVCILIAGDYSIHSEAIQETMKQLRGTPEAHPLNVSLIYGRAIQAIKRRQAEDIYLAPLGMNTDTFFAQQKDLSDSFVDRLTTQLQEYRGEDVEALVVGSDGENAHIYQVNSKGVGSCLDDVGFGAIGMGAWHAKSRLMQNGYVNTTNFGTALALTFAAKKSAEIAPGVGTATDLRLVLKNTIDPIRLDATHKLEELYKNYESLRIVLATNIVQELHNFMSNIGRPEQDVKNSKSEPTTDARFDARPAQPTSEAAQKDEGGPEAPSD